MASVPPIGPWFNYERASVAFVSFAAQSGPRARRTCREEKAILHIREEEQDIFPRMRSFPLRARFFGAPFASDGTSPNTCTRGLVAGGCAPMKGVAPPRSIQATSAAVRRHSCFPRSTRCRRSEGNPGSTRGTNLEQTKNPLMVILYSMAQRAPAGPEMRE